MRHQITIVPELNEHFVAKLHRQLQMTSIVFSKILFSSFPRSTPHIFLFFLPLIFAMTVTTDNTPRKELSNKLTTLQVDENTPPVQTDALKQLKKEADKKPAAAAAAEAPVDEPLLQANPNRFVLFPIKYHDVCHSLSSCMFSSCCSTMFILNSSMYSIILHHFPVNRKDLANVQEGGSVFLDG
jgi:hypothetical protein